MNNSNFVMVAVPQNLTQKVFNLLQENGAQGTRSQNNIQQNGNISRSQNGNRSTNEIQTPTKSRNGSGNKTGNSYQVSNVSNVTHQNLANWNRERLQLVWNNSSKSTRKILKYLASKPNQNITAEEIVKHTDMISPFQVVEVLSSFSDGIKKTEATKPPFLRRFEGKQVQYMIPQNIAQQIIKF